jgi:serine/threonine protein kinase
MIREKKGFLCTTKEKISKGRWGKIWKAEWIAEENPRPPIQRHQKYVIKEMTTRKGKNKNNRLAIRELRTVRYMLTFPTHPHITYAQSSWKSKGVHISTCIVYDEAYCDLFHYIDTHKHLCLEECKRVIGQVASGLDYMHSVMNLVHNDIKPENILLFSESSTSFVYKITDFGATCPPDKARTGNQHVYTDIFVSPERNREDHYTFSSDIWSLGVMFLDCLLGVESFPHVFSEKEWKCPFEYSFSRYLQSHLHEENDWITVFVDNTIDWMPERRMPAKDIVHFCRT